ncbi:MAG: putative cysteine ligase BshC [Syntrophomonadaceae bacterium]|nr:putative cysteine ligase BshC [Bacillota bacterium]
MLKPYALPPETLSALYRDYLTGLPRAVDFLGRHYADVRAFGETADRVTAAYQGERRGVADMLLAYNREMGSSAKTLENAEKLADPRALAVLAGQQAGLCGGPLYTVYKAIAAVKLADSLEKKLGCPVVPVFWVASEDHDFSEANHLWLMDKENRLQRVNLDLEHRGEPVGRLLFDESAVSQVVGKVAELLQESEFSGEVLEMLNETGKASFTPADWFARLFARLFADEGLVLFDPLLPQAREMLAPFFAEVAARQTEIKDTLQAAEANIRAAGYPLQVEREENASLLMWMGEQRSALYFRNGRFATRDGAVSFSTTALRESALTTPEKLSPNVLLRPLAQDRLFPTAAYLLGPGELGYFAQMLPLYSLFGIPRPVLVPRPGLTIVEPRLARYIRRYEIAEDNLLDGRLDSAMQKTVSRQNGIDVDALFSRLRRQMQEEYEGLQKELARLDKELVGLAEKNLQHVYAETAYLQKAAREKSRQKNEVIIRHFNALKQSLLPRELLQERVLNVIPFLCKYGPSFWQELKAEFPVMPGHYLYYF